MQSDVNYVLGDQLPETGDAIEVAEGVLWVRMPLPFALNHVNLFLLEDGDGWTLVDTGIASTEIKQAWDAVLAKYLGGKPITRIIVTHYHPDHMGCTGWLMEKYPGDLLMTRTEWLSARATKLEEASNFVNGVSKFYGKTGLSPTMLADMQDLGNSYARMVSDVPMSYTRIKADSEIEIGGRIWKPIIASGHSPEHACLWCDEHKLLLGGDFLLPRISPNISVWWSEPESNPLKDYIEFLGTLDHINEETLILPSHDRPYIGLGLRTKDLRTHHQDRLDICMDVCREAPATAAEAMTALFKRQLDAHQTRFAIGEALSHLNVLVEDGSISKWLDDEGVWRYQVA